MVPVGGPFRSTLMLPAKEELATVIEAANFNSPTCLVYQNVLSKVITYPAIIKQKHINQLTDAARWTQIVPAMFAVGATRFTKVGPGSVLQGLVMKIKKERVVDEVC